MYVNNTFINKAVNEDGYLIAQIGYEVLVITSKMALLSCAFGDIEVKISEAIDRLVSQRWDKIEYNKERWKLICVLKPY